MTPSEKLLAVHPVSVCVSAKQLAQTRFVPQTVFDCRGSDGLGKEEPSGAYRSVADVAVHFVL